MAHYDATHAHAHDAGHHGIGWYLAAPFRAVWSFLMAVAESNAQVRQVDRLSAMSDAELARRGIRREEIIREVFFKATLY